jgi:hypothetical protein
MDMDCICGCRRRRRQPLFRLLGGRACAHLLAKHHEELKGDVGDEDEVDQPVDDEERVGGAPRRREEADLIGRDRSGEDQGER